MIALYSDFDRLLDRGVPLVFGRPLEVDLKARFCDDNGQRGRHTALVATFFVDKTASAGGSLAPKRQVGCGKSATGNNIENKNYFR